MLLFELKYPNKVPTVASGLSRGWDIEEAIFKKPGNNYSGRFKKNNSTNET